MPSHPGKDLSMAAQGAAGIPEGGAVPGGGEDLDSVLAALQSGQMSAEQLLLLLTLLSGAGGGMPGGDPMMAGPPGMPGGGPMGPGGPAGPAPGGSPIEEAFLL